MNTVTQWFDGDVKPSREGVYQTYLFDSAIRGYSFFDGVKWMDTERSIEEALKTEFAGVQYKHWRGLAEQPK